MSTTETPESILDFWFTEPLRSHWFGAPPEIDALITERFESLWRAARDGNLDDWAQTPAGALALVIILDQFPLNMYRGEAESFATEARSRAIAAQAIAAGMDREFSTEQKLFLYLPYMHSESMADQHRSIELFTKAGMTQQLPWAQHHYRIVERFGRFPHRNAPLGRVSTPEELAWLNSQDGFRG
ncbi:MAG: DUF924 domain-containing protein [Chromatiales bacterium]|nr:DUF924 domain-containing protein [Gammaproteobacteria bacterium]MCP5352857.1 DUF924 domain-containing protein [Chromatiales bacterium]